MYLIITQENKANGKLLSFVFQGTFEKTQEFCRDHNNEICRVFPVDLGGIADKDGTVKWQSIIE